METLLYLAAKSPIEQLSNVIEESEQQNNDYKTA